ncbi:MULTISPECIES: Fe-S cluster assembly protein SufD [Methylosinus]|uniref:Fe-S cluster assembly protein SufD n=1 Tax=Methylosinus trichosporium (strain ATCC 35070 / NCIMB 11131 / UNIQEM 75 / OB3b) TaxID=595536 RepID=A0A2D2CVD8_METT3|nr:MULTISPECIES: Fe-S cluster assembly protein SufD [Methylosinus]ATQ66697.1 Fe-S cluster assembly protein SufD [Methylosinus trichosporium OB3b]OBS53366.1 Fe-S cluster assembly protein SufD [Methylosinus sp. 3S-1]
MTVQAIDKKSEAETALAGAFEAMKSKGAPALRQASWEFFARKGLPTRRVEAWHYTDLRAALRAVAPLGAPETVAVPAAAEGRVRLVVADGAFRPDLSNVAALPAGVEFVSLADALAKDDAAVLAALGLPENAGADAIVALNAALMQDGVVLRIAPAIEVAKTIEILLLSSGDTARSAFTRSLVIVGDGAKAKIIETSLALAPSGAQENHVLAFSIGAGAEVEHISDIGPQSEAAIRLFSLMVTAQTKASFKSLGYIEGGGLVRRQIFARLAGEEASLSLDGVALLGGKDHADTTLVVEHAAAHCQSRERFRNVLDGQSTGVFQGKVVVRPGAQKTDGSMQSRALLLSENATMNNKPELEIFADDVVCGHGATCGRLNADQLFYLEARGLPKREAEALLIEGFAGEIVDAVSEEATREAYFARIRSWLGRREAGK